MVIAYWDFKNTPFNNAKANILASAEATRNGSKELRELLVEFPKNANGTLGKYDMMPYIRTEYGNNTPICLLDKILRELKRIWGQIVSFVEDVAKFASKAIEDVLSFVLNAAQQTVSFIVNAAKRAYDKAEDFVSDTISSIFSF